MAIPTRFIEAEEWEELLALEEGDVIAIFKLTAIPFQPPLPDGEEPHTPLADNKTAVRVMKLPVVEPRLYRDPHKNVFIIYPSFNTLTYDDAQDMHPIKGAWCYRFAPSNWDGNDPLKHATYLFEDVALEAYDPADPATH